MNDIATKQDITQVQGNLSEEMITLKRNVTQIENEFEESSHQSKTFKEGTNTNFKNLAVKIENIQQQITSLEQKISKIQSQQSDLESHIQQTLQSQAKAIESQRNSDLSTMDKKIGIVLEEVSKENDRLLREIHGSRSASTKTIIPAGDFYIVKPGESLSQIAARYGVSPQSLAQANNVTNANSVRSGQKLVIPKKTAS